MTLFATWSPLGTTYGFEGEKGALCVSCVSTENCHVQTQRRKMDTVKFLASLRGPWLPQNHLQKAEQASGCGERGPGGSQVLMVSCPAIFWDSVFNPFLNYSSPSQHPFLLVSCKPAMFSYRKAQQLTRTQFWPLSSLGHIPTALLLM